MKKSIKRVVSVLLLAVMLTCVLTACTTKLSGTYTNDEGLIKQSVIFEKDNKIKLSAFGINLEGEYRIEGDEITITYSLLSLSYDWKKSFEKKGNSIFIDGTEFVKE